MNATAPTSAAEQAVARFLERLAVERRASPHTVAAYRRDLARLTAWMGARNLAAIDALSPDLLRGFIAAAHRTGLAPTSLQRLLASCRALFRALAREGLLTSDPAAGVRAPRARRRLPVVLDVDAAAQLMESPGDDRLGVRDRALLELLYSSGLRLAELTGLRWEALDLDGGQVRVTGKGQKTRVVPVGRHAVTALRALAVTGAAPQAPVFLGRGGGPLSPRAVQARLHTLAQRHGLPQRLHPHLLRHTCASHLLESSGELRAVQELLGHADIATTEIYTHLDFQHLARVYDAAHPRARRKAS